MRSYWSYYIQRLPLSHGASIPVFSTRDLPFEPPSTTARGRCLMAPCPWVQTKAEYLTRWNIVKCLKFAKIQLKVGMVYIPPMSGTFWYGSWLWRINSEAQLSQVAMWRHLPSNVLGGVPCWNGGAVWEQSWDQCTCRFSAHEASWIVNEFMHTYVSYNS
jgi:hypothetical protein